MNFKDGSKTGGWGGAGCLVAIVLLIISVLISMAWSALAIGAANSWIFLGNFTDGWHAAWGRPWVLLGWSILFVVGAAGSQRSKRS